MPNWYGKASIVLHASSSFSLSRLLIARMILWPCRGRGGVGWDAGTASANCIAINTRKHISAHELSFHYLASDRKICLISRWRFPPTNASIQIPKYSSVWMEARVRAWPLSENNRLSICKRELCLPCASFVWPRTWWQIFSLFCFLQKNLCVWTWCGCVGGSLCVCVCVCAHVHSVLLSR